MRKDAQNCFSHFWYSYQVFPLVILNKPELKHDFQTKDLIHGTLSNLSQISFFYFNEKTICYLANCRDHTHLLKVSNFGFCLTWNKIKK